MMVFMPLVLVWFGQFRHNVIGRQNMKVVVIVNRRFPSCLSPLFQSESLCEVFHMEISFIHM